MDPFIQANNMLRTRIPKIQIIVQVLSGTVCSAEGYAPQYLKFLFQLPRNSPGPGFLILGLF